jgi:hypothetical protein
MYVNEQAKFIIGSLENTGDAIFYFEGIIPKRLCAVGSFILNLCCWFSGRFVLPFPLSPAFKF